MAQSCASSKLQAIRWDRPRLSILNQLLLPHASEYVEIRTSADGHHAIVSMQTRGAPAIAIVAALSLAAEISQQEFASAQQAYDFIVARLDYLATSRPTAVNLFDAVSKLKAVAASSLEHQNPPATGSSVVQAYVDAAEHMLAADVRDNQAIGQHGAQYIAMRAAEQGLAKFKLLTHCNTGALATAGHGTALGIIRSLHQSSGSGSGQSARGAALLEHVYFGETRPYNQGARLTAYELLCEGIPSTLVCDSAVSALLRRDPSIVAIVVGADRVAANGDTANKIGTYQLAITARFHGRDFIVAAPSSSIDLGLASGEGIVIEERDPREITRAEGFVLGGLDSGRLERETLCVAPRETQAWNPSFDVTPAELVSAIVTEKQVFVKTAGAKTYDLEKCLGA
ncbi:S-methyl-5-thioribose-1-phosphate isomerase [Coemansia sp. RSA 2703]|nr:S-methyl-5-thioribose-1-phosphate isomerase [Coemansia sp. RSA 2703]KAJ2379516.1 S-methyl-5-thioribose-1-phosphate isomerase [Coemansia sp. RSA 2607]KAJ2398504.1 S-methyl-5-thioribose-1-phosphate isomerase [Coemansia sp. RSA 2603]